MRIRSLGAATTVFAVALAGTACGPGEPTEVLGEVYERPAPSADEAALTEVEPVVAPPRSTTVPPLPAGDGEQPAPAGAAAGLAGTAATPPSTTVAAAPAPRPVTREHSDNAATLIVLGGKVDAAVSSTRIEEGAANPFVFDVSLPPEPPVTVQISLTNAAPSPVGFLGGLAMTVSIARDGQPWRTEQVGDPAVTSLAPGATWSTTITIPADGDGAYDITAFVDVVHA